MSESTQKPKPKEDKVENYTKLKEALKAGFLEMETPIDILSNALISEQNVVLVGPPGTAKSNLIKQFSENLDLPFFQYLIGRYTTPDELLGHFSLKQLKENDKQVRQTKGKMPESRIAFLDEWEKGNSGTMNSLLTIMNEKEYDVGDGTRVKTDLEMVVGASNSYPKDPSLSPLWDRWVFRVEVEDITHDRSFVRLMLEDNIGQVSCPVSFEEVESLRQARRNVDIASVVGKLQDIRQELLEKSIRVSARRWRQCVKIIQAEAAIDGRSEAVEKDVRILRHVLWSTPAERMTVSDIINQIVAGDISKAEKGHDAASSLMDAMKELPKKGYTSEMVQVRSNLDLLYSDMQKLDQNDQTVRDLTAEVASMYNEMGAMIKRSI